MPLLRERDEYGMQVWYEPLREFTFHSTSYLLSPQQIDEILNGIYNPELLEILDAIIDGYNRKVFPRLHLVSPKHFRPCTSASEILDILRITPRTFSVLKEAHDSKTDCPLFLREWRDFSDMTEVRCFIVDGRVTACCQNDSQSDSEPIENPKEVKQRVLSFVERLIPFCPYRECTLDLALNSTAIYLVEINTPFTMLAGTGLFEYPAESKLLENGTPNGPVFRYYKSLFYEIAED